MRSFTLDTNCIIDFAENRPAAEAVRALCDRSAEGLVSVAVVAERFRTNTESERR